MAVALSPTPPARLQIVRKGAWIPAPLQARMTAWQPRTGLGRVVRDCLQYLPPEQAEALLDQIVSCVVVESQLSLVKIWGPRGPHPGRRDDYGVVSRKVVTDTGVGFIVDAFQNSVEAENMKYHALGTGTNAEAVGDTALQTELTTEYTGNVRATGTTEEGATANIYKTVGTNTLDSGTPAVTEHGIFSANAAGVLLDRSKFSAINLVGANGDGIQSTYQLTFTSGG